MEQDIQKILDELAFSMDNRTIVFDVQVIGIESLREIQISAGSFLR